MPLSINLKIKIFNCLIYQEYFCYCNYFYVYDLEK